MRKVTVGLRDVRFHAPHGVHPEEAILGGEYRVHVSCELRAALSPTEDRLGDTLDYGSLHAICRAVFAGRVQLIETLAHRIVERIRQQHGAQVAAVRVEIEKVAPPLGGRVGASFVVWEESF